MKIKIKIFKQNENYSDSFGQGDILNSDKNNGFSPNISHQSKDLNKDNNTQLGQQILGKLDELINKSSETNEAMKNATMEMKESNAHQKKMLDLLIELVKKLPIPKSEDGKNNTNK